MIEGATESAAAAQALLDNLIDRGLDPKLPRLFILDGVKALSKAVRAKFGRQTLIQRYQVHKARNIAERYPKKHVASVRRTLRKAWELDDATKAERLIRELARRMEKDAPGVSGSILEGLDEILTVNRLRLPPELRRSLAYTNAIENMQGTIRRVTTNVKRWRDASMALRWAAAGMLEAKTDFRRLKACGQLPTLCRALAEHHLCRPGMPEYLDRLACAPRGYDCAAGALHLPEGRLLLEGQADNRNTRRLAHFGGRTLPKSATIFRG